MTSAEQSELEQAHAALDLCRWLAGLDDRTDPLARQERAKVTLTQICNKAREALSRAGEYSVRRTT